MPAQGIVAMNAAGQVTAALPFAPDQVQPASLDLRLGPEAFRVRASFLPGPAPLAERLSDFEMHRIDLRPGAVLEKGCVYVVPLVEGLALPPGISAVANAKSSTGRLDLFTRLITDRGTEFDRIEPGYAGPLFAEISPRSFSVLVRPGMRLNQIRFRRGSAVLDDDALRRLDSAERLVGGEAHIAGGLAF
jgi:dCTP deaminase